MVVLWGCYAASCVDLRGVDRDYYGITQVRVNQSRLGACERRKMHCLNKPVRHFASMRPDTLTYKPLGHLMVLDSALAEEALRTATAVVAGDFARGGPWQFPSLGAAARREVKAVARLAARFADRAEARQALHVYATKLPDTARLRRHLEDRPFARDSAECSSSDQPVAASKRRSGRSRSGSQKRKRLKLSPGTEAYDQHKWGPNAAEKRQVADRRRWLKKHPNAREYQPRK